MSIAPPIACWKAPSWESALLTASGETCEVAAGVGASLDGEGRRRWRRALVIESGDAVVANGSGMLGAAVTANGFTGAFGSAPLRSAAEAFTLDEGLVGAATPPLMVLGPGTMGGRRAGAPHAAQNFADPMSSALHVAQLAMAALHVGSPGSFLQERFVSRLFVGAWPVDLCARRPPSRPWRSGRCAASAARLALSDLA